MDRDIPYHIQTLCQVFLKKKNELKMLISLFFKKIKTYICLNMVGNELTSHKNRTAYIRIKEREKEEKKKNLFTIYYCIL